MAVARGGGQNRLHRRRLHRAAADRPLRGFVRSAARRCSRGFPGPAVEIFLKAALEERRRKALECGEPSQTNQIITHGLPSLLLLTGNRWRQRNREFPPAWTCCLRAPRATWLSACVTTGPVPDWLRLDQLRKLAEDAPATKLILLRDSRLPIGRTAAKTRELRERLLKKGARWVEPSAEALATLDALRRLLSDAKSASWTIAATPWN